MQNRMESNIRDKFLVKMIKLQEFTEKKRIAEMLNEMNPKLKALLAAGLIGTAGLGMQSCSNPSDSVYYPYTVETTTTDNPGSGGAETSNPSGGEENGGNGRETVEETEEQKWAKTPFGQLNVKKEDAARIVEVSDLCNKYDGFDPDQWPLTINALYVYTDSGFSKKEHTYQTGYAYICKHAENEYDVYYIPESMEDSFIDAIKAYKDSQSNQ